MGYSIFESDPDALNPAWEWSFLSGNWMGAASPPVKKIARGLGTVATNAVKGVQGVHVTLRMEWVEDDGIWYGEWHWVADYHHPRSERRRQESRNELVRGFWYKQQIRYHELHMEKPAQRSRHEGGLPMEVVLLVCERALADWNSQVHDRDPPSHTAGSGELVRALALVCRTTANICASVLCQTLVIDATDVDKFVRCISDRRSTGYAATHCEKLILRDRGAKLWDACAAITPVLSLLPQAATLYLQQPKDSVSSKAGEDAPFHHLRYPCVVPTLRETASTITSLELISHAFTSSLDLLRLLGSFPSLGSARLHDVSCTRIGGHADGASSRWPTQLRQVKLEACRSPADSDLLGPFFVTWTWFRLPSDSYPIGFPGLDPCEARTVSSICRCLCVSDATDTSGSIFLDVSHDSNRWVAWIAHKQLHVEFHLVCKSLHTSNGPGRNVDTAAARVQKIVLRPWPRISNTSLTLKDYFHDPETTIPSMDKYLATLPDLDSFVLESETDTWHSLLRHEPGLLRARLRILGNSSKSLVRNTTCTAARQRASKMRQGGGQDGLCDSALPVSPLWWYDTYQDMRPQLGK